MYISLAGEWKARLADGTAGTVTLPGTLDESSIGHRDSGANQWHPDAALGNADESFDADAPIATRFTRKHTYEGEARFEKTFDLRLQEGKRVFLKAERARVLRLMIDDREVLPFRPASLSSPYIFEVTGLLQGQHKLTLVSDNSYPGLPHDSITYSSAATDETQTNWNGVLGELGLYTEEPVFIESLRVLPADNRILKVRANISADRSFHGFLRIESECLREPAEVAVDLEKPGEKEIQIEGCRLTEGCRLWDEEEGNLYELRGSLFAGEASSAGTFRGDVREAGSVTAAESGTAGRSYGDVRETDGLCGEKTVVFGIRSFGDNGRGRLALNGRTIFLRSEANCAEFPETGHAPMTVPEWEEILSRYRSYGVNCVRFHSHCPPEAAYTAADRLGMLMQPELSHWNPKDAFESEESYAYYRTELEAVIRMLANHPSFVMLTLGNELQAGDTGHRRMNELLALARELDDTRLYANGSNVHYGEMGCDPESDFYASQSCYEARIRGTFSGMEGYINKQYPGARTNYDRDMELIRRDYRKPVFSFEVGQFEVLPDFRELELFKGISEPANLRLIRDKVQKLGLEDGWERRVEATGELSLLGYREEIEAAMRTKELSGISLLGLQDFPGQGTALVGMMNSHLLPKPYDFARPERFQAFFRDSLPLVQLKRYTYEAGETLRAQVLVANFGKRDLDGEWKYELRPKTRAGRGESPHARETAAGGVEGSLSAVSCPTGEYTVAGTIEIPLNFVTRAQRFDLRVRLEEKGNGNTCPVENTYPVWVYPKAVPRCPEGVLETESLDDRARQTLARGGVVYLSPRSDKEHLPQSIQAQFTTDFWSVGTFSGQEGGMGQLIDERHPLFADFPTEFHTEWQWWIFATQRAVILPRPMKAIVAELDSYAYLRPMAQLLEFRCGGGRVLFSTLGLQDLQEYPEARALLNSVYRYLESKDFAPGQELAPEELAELVK